MEPEHDKRGGVSGGFSHGEGGEGGGVGGGVGGGGGGEGGGYVIYGVIVPGNGCVCVRNEITVTVWETSAHIIITHST